MSALRCFECGCVYSIEGHSDDCSRSQGIEAFGRDGNRLDAKHESPAAEGGAPRRDAQPTVTFQEEAVTEAKAIALQAIADVRHRAAASFEEGFSGVRGQAYDRAVLDCYDAVRFAMTNARDGTE